MLALIIIMTMNACSQSHCNNNSLTITLDATSSKYPIVTSVISNPNELSSSIDNDDKINIIVVLPNLHKIDWTEVSQEQMNRSNNQKKTICSPLQVWGLTPCTTYNNYK